MRTAIIIIITILLMAGAFTAYTSCQGPMNTAVAPAGRDNTPVAPPPDQSQRGFSAGEGAWVESYGAVTGRLSTRFRGARFTPRQDGTVEVERPQAEFWLGDGQVLRVTGARGEVVMPASTPRTGQGLIKGPSQMPSRGRIEDVELLLFESVQDMDAQRPMIVAKINNIAFDNDTLRMHTESYTAPDGTVVPADEVPVVVTGRYEFEGYGLQLRWNQRDQRLQRLRVARGKRLLVRDLDFAAMPAAEAALPAERMPLPLVLAQADGAVPLEEKVYRATFIGSVHVRQSTGEEVTADVLQIDVSPEPSSSRRATTRQRAATEPAAPQPAPEPAPAPDVPQPQKAEMEITWTGPLEIVPAEEIAKPVPPPGHAVIRLSGQRVVAKQEGSSVEAALVIYETSPQRLWLEGGEGKPVIMTDAKGARVETASMLYSANERMAQLTGASSFVVPVSDGEGEATSTLVARWKKSCDLRLGQTDGRELRIESADLSGEVYVEHPELQLKASSLLLGFDPDIPAGDAAALQSLKATGDVMCVIGQEEERRQIECQSLTMHAPVDRGEVRTVLAEGDVLATDGHEELAAQRLEIDLVPDEASERAFQVQRVQASGKVRVTTADGVIAAAEQLRVTGPEDAQVVELSGEGGARVSRGDSMLVGPSLWLDPARQRAEVRGAGSLHAKQVDESGKPRPMDVAWTKRLQVDVGNKLIIADGDVVATTPGSDGSLNTASAQKATLMLEKPAATQPAKKSDVSRSVAFEDVVVRSVVLEKEVEVRTVLSAADGSLLRRMNLLAERVEYDVNGQTLLVPVPGRLLYEDRRPGDPNRAGNTPEARGATAIQWQKRLIFDPESSQARLYGDVIVVHEPAEVKNPRLRLDAEALLVKFADMKRAEDGTVEARAESVHAEGPVRFSARNVNFEAAVVDFDLASQVLTAQGTSAEPGMLYDDGWLSKGSFRSLTWNARTEELQMRDFRASARPRSADFIK